MIESILISPTHVQGFETSNKNISNIDQKKQIVGLRKFEQPSFDACINIIVAINNSIAREYSFPNSKLSAPSKQRKEIQNLSEEKNVSDEEEQSSVLEVESNNLTDKVYFSEANSSFESQKTKIQKLLDAKIVRKNKQTHTSSLDAEKFISYIKSICEYAKFFLIASGEIFKFSIKCLNNLALVSLCFIKELSIIKNFTLNIHKHSTTSIIRNQTKHVYNISILYLVNKARS